MASAGLDGRSRSVRGQQTRQRLLEAGSKVFSSRGLHAARVDDVVKAAGTSHGTFYLYFTSKEDLFTQLSEEVAAELVALVDGFPALRNTARSRAELRDRLDRFATLYERYGPVIRTWTEAESSGPSRSPARLSNELSDQASHEPSEGDRATAPSGSSADNDLLSGLTGTLTAKVRLPKRSGLDPAIATLALLAMCERLYYYADTGQITATRDELLDTMLEVIDAVIHP